MDKDSFHRVVSIPAWFNTDNLLEFSIEPDKRYLNLSRTYLKFYVELPEVFVPDNNFGNKLFEYLDVNVQYEDASFKCSSNDYDHTSHIQDQIFKNPSYVKKMKFEGHFDNLNIDSSQLKSDAQLVANRRGSPFTRTKKSGNKTVEEKYYRYQMILPINHGLAKNDQLLPAGVHLRLTFHRAQPKKALVDISQSIATYPTKTIELIQPTLHVCWASSPSLHEQMSRIKEAGLTIPYESAHIRHRTLDDGLSEYNVQIMQGQVPKYIAFFLMEPDRFNNDFKLSSTKMTRHNLTEFSILMDNDVLQHYPLKVEKYGDSIFSHQFYRRFLIMTGQYGDSHDDILSEEVFIDDNFLILETFADSENKEGMLSVKLKFAEQLNSKLHLCWMPVFEKHLKFDRNLSVQIS